MSDQTTEKVKGLPENAYTELNDPAVQEENFRLQLRGQQETMATMDHDFITALKYGMPPVCGFGMSERFFSFLMNKTTRECQIFPLMKPEK